jgi:hypothetical protein
MKPPRNCGSARSRSTGSRSAPVVRVLLCCHTHPFDVDAIPSPAVARTDLPSAWPPSYRSPSGSGASWPLGSSFRRGWRCPEFLRGCCGAPADLRVRRAGRPRHRRVSRARHRISVARAAAVFLPAVVHEELLFRGYPFQKLLRWNRAFAIFFVALVFAALHIRQRVRHRARLVNIFLGGSSSASRTSATAASGSRSACISPGTSPPVRSSATRSAATRSAAACSSSAAAVRTADRRGVRGGRERVDDRRRARPPSR